MVMKTRTLVTAISAVLIGTAALSGAVFGKGKPTTGESGVNNLSFPVILSDNVGPAAFPADGAWRWAAVADPTTQCIGEIGVTTGTVVDPTILCYYGRKITVVSETGEIVFSGEPKVWWLQKRTQNFWKALSVGHDITTPLAVSAVDIGDLLESSPSIATRQIRVEFNLLQSVDPADLELGQYVGLEKCVAPPTGAPYSIGCFAAFGMSGAVPGTEQSGNEMQGNDFGPGGSVPYPGTQTLVDPTTVRVASNGDPIHALVYSRCARLLIQKIGEGPVSWDPVKGQWTGSTVALTPAVNLPVYTNALSVEITSGGSIVYGYNWNAKTASTGKYRLTLVLDGNDDVGPQCNVPLGTKFESGVTDLVNAGENNPSGDILYSGGTGGDEGGIAYLDLTLTAKGGGSRGGSTGGQPPTSTRR
jgi:hypothetical protein